MVGSSLNEAVTALLTKYRPKRTYNNDSVQLHVLLKDYALETDAPFSGSTRLSHKIFPKLKVCVLGDDEHCQEAEENLIHCLNSLSVDTFYNIRTDVKKLAWSYDVFLASESRIEEMPFIIGPHFARVSKTPLKLTHDESLMGKIEELKFTVKFEFKRSLNLCATVGHVRMRPAQLSDNIVTSLRYLVTLLKDKWANIQSAHIKTPKGQKYFIY